MPEHSVFWQTLDQTARTRWAAALLAVAFAVRLPVFFVTFASGDEATYSALATALLDGQRLYAGAVDHKPPLLAATYAAIQVVSGSIDIHIVHAASILIVCATAFLLSSLSGRFGLCAAEQRAAALVYVLAASTGPGKDMLAANGEILMALPAVAALVVAWPRPEPAAHGVATAWRWPVAGALAAIAALFKYQGLAILAPLTVLAASGAGMRLLFARGAGVLAGVAVPAAALIGWYWSAGDLASIVFWGWTYPLSYAGSLAPWHAAANALRMSAWWSLLSAGVLAAVVIGWRAGAGLRDPVAHCSFHWLSAAWIAGALAGVAAGGRFFLHYYLQLLPPLCLLAARGFSRMAASGSSRRTFFITTALVLLAASGSWVINAAPGSFQPMRAVEDAAYRRIADFVNTHSKPTESLFVWGNSPEIYYYARRPMGTRFPFCNYHSGKIWGTPSDRAGAPIDPKLVVEPVWRMLLSDMDLRRPAWIVDAAAAGLDRWQGHEIERYPRLASIVASRYRHVATVAGAEIYERLDRSGQETGPGLRGIGR